MAGEIDIKKLAQQLAEENARMNRRPATRAGAEAGPNQQLENEVNKLIEERVKLKESIAKHDKAIAESERDIEKSIRNQRAEEERIRRTKSDIQKIEQELKKAETQANRLQMGRTRAQKEAFKAKRDEIKQGQELLKQKKTEFDTARKTAKLQKDTVAQTKAAQKTIRDSVAMQRNLESKLGGQSDALKQINRLKPSPFMSALAGEGGPARGVLEAVRAARAQGQANKVSEAIGGPKGPSPFKAALGAAAEHGGGGAFSGIAGLAGKGGPWGLAFEAIKKVGAASLDIEDKLLKLTARYIKSSNQIPATFGQAVVSLQKFQKEYVTAYTGAIEQSKLFGVSTDEVYVKIDELGRSFKLQGDGMGQTLADLSGSSFKFATLFDKSADQISDSMTDTFKRFGHSAEQVQSDLSEMYNVFTEGNQKLQKQFKENVIRIDEFSDIVFESARNSDLWNFSYRGTAGLLTVIAARAKEAGLSIEKQQKIAKGLLGFAQGGTRYENMQAGLGVIGKFQGVTDEQELLKQLKAQGETSAENRKQIVEALKQARLDIEQGSSPELAAEELMQRISGTVTGMSGRLESLTGLLKQVDQKDRQAQLELIRTRLNIPEERRAEAGQILNILKSGKPIAEQAAEFAKLAGEKPKEKTEELTGKPGQAGGAQTIEFAARGIQDSAANLAESFTELQKATYLAGNALKLLAAAAGDQEALRALKAEEFLKTEEAKKLSPAMLEAVKKTNIVPTEKTGGMFGVESLGGRSLLERMATPEFQGQTRNLKLYDIKRATGASTEAAEVMLKAFEAERMGGTPEQLQQRMQEERQRGEGQVRPQPMLPTIDDPAALQKIGSAGNRGTGALLNNALEATGPATYDRDRGEMTIKVKVVETNAAKVNAQEAVKAAQEASGIPAR